MATVSKVSLIKLFLLTSVGLMAVISCTEMHEDLPSEVLEDETLEKTCDFPLYPPVDTVIASHTTWAQGHYGTKITEFKQDSIFSNSIIMLGNSLTEQGGDWSEKLGVERVKNRGISGDNCDGLNARLGEIICAEPTAVFVMIGTNDLWTSYTTAEVASKIHEIGNHLSENMPDTKVFIQTIMPVGESIDRDTRLRSINTLLKAYQDTNYTLLDTWQHMANADGYLDGSMTTDGVHLTNVGYAKWVEFLKPNLQ